MEETETDDDAEGRWAAARGLAEGVRDDQYGRRRIKTWLFLFLLLMAVAAAAVLLAVVLPNGDRVQVPETRQWAELTLAICAAVWIVAVLVHGFRSKTFIPRWRAVLSPLNRAERRRVSKQWRGSIPVSDEELPVIKAAAIQTRIQMDFLGRLGGGWVLLLAGQLLNTELALVQIINAAALILFVVAAAILVRDRRRISGFLRRAG